MQHDLYSGRNKVSQEHDGRFSITKKTTNLIFYYRNMIESPSHVIPSSLFATIIQFLELISNY
jgi:hypothetical protein